MSTHSVLDGGTTMPPRRRVPVYHNSPPQFGNDVDLAPTDARLEFGRRLSKLIAARNWNQSDLARHATQHMPGKQAFRRDNVSNYVRGRQIPGPVRLKALCKTLGVTREDLVPPAAVQSVDNRAPPLEMRSAGPGRAFLKVNQVVSQELAMQIIALLEGERKKGEGS